MNTAPIVVESAGQLHAQCCALAITKDLLLGYLASAPVLERSDKQLADQIDPQGESIEDAWHTDGTWRWSRELIAYVERHDAALPGELARHIAAQRTRA